MVNVGLWVRLEAKPGKEKDVETFLRNGLPLVRDEPATTAWFGVKLGPSSFGIFDAFADESGRQAHLAGRVAASGDRDSRRTRRQGAGPVVAHRQYPVAPAAAIRFGKAGRGGAGAAVPN
jgi:hypothetical protein